MSNPPIETLKLGSVQVAVWKSDGGKLSFSCKRRYKDKNTNEYKDATSFFEEDLAHLQVLLQVASTKALEFRKKAEAKTISAQSPVIQAAKPAAQVEDDIPF